MAKDYKGPMILVGFGKFELVDVVKFIGTDREDELLQMPIKHIPRYRKPSSCLPEQVETFVQYVNWLSDKFEIPLDQPVE